MQVSTNFLALTTNQIDLGFKQKWELYIKRILAEYPKATFTLQPFTKSV